MGAGLLREPLLFLGEDNGSTVNRLRRRIIVWDGCVGSARVVARSETLFSERPGSREEQQSDGQILLARVLPTPNDPASHARQDASFSALVSACPLVEFHFGRLSSTQGAFRKRVATAGHSRYGRTNRRTLTSTSRCACSTTAGATSTTVRWWSHTSRSRTCAVLGQGKAEDNSDCSRRVLLLRNPSRNVGRTPVSLGTSAASLERKPAWPMQSRYHDTKATAVVRRANRSQSDPSARASGVGTVRGLQGEATDQRAGYAATRCTLSARALISNTIAGGTANQGVMQGALESMYWIASRRICPG